MSGESVKHARYAPMAVALWRILGEMDLWSDPVYGNSYVLMLFLCCREYLTGFHKRKVERRKAAVEEIKRKLKEEQRKMKEEVLFLHGLVWLAG